MSKKLHRVTIFFDDKEMKRVYNAVAKKEMLPSKLLKKIVIDYLEKLETEDSEEWDFEKPSVEDKEAVIS
jgi:replicative DNA helicase